MGIRAYHKPRPAPAHSHGGDPAAADALTASTGAARVALLGKYLDDPDHARRLAVAEALEYETAPEAMSLAARALRDNDSEIRRQAARAIARNSSRASDPLIRAALRDDDAWVREEVVRAVAASVASPHGKWLVADLMPLVDDPDPSVRLFATFALHKRADKPWRIHSRGTEADALKIREKWKTWWATSPSGYPTLPLVEPIAAVRVDPAPDVAIQTLDGKSFSPATDKRITLVHFWGTWCAPCQDEVKEIQRVHQTFEPKGVQVVGVALSEPGGEAGLKAYCAEKGLTFPQTIDDAIPEAYGDVLEIPVTVLIDAHGKIRYRWHGERDRSLYSLIRRSEKASCGRSSRWSSCR